MANKKKAFDPSHSGTLKNIQQTVKEIGEQLRGIEEDIGEEAKYNLFRLKVFVDVQGESELQGRLELGKQRLLESRLT